MRDYERYRDDDDDLDDDDWISDAGRSRRRSAAFDAAESILLLGALALIAMPAIKGIARRYRVAQGDLPRQRRTGLALRRHPGQPTRFDDALTIPRDFPGCARLHSLRVRA
jgi:hypothetical protein